eukprot:7291446-Ditylum_brightwellii.AAC.2
MREVQGMSHLPYQTKMRTIFHCTNKCLQWDELIGDPENRLPCYLLKDGEKKGYFCIDHVIEEANKIWTVITT